MDLWHESVGLVDDVDQGEAKRPSHTPGGRGLRDGRQEVPTS
jgi:hypothetical protein